MQQPTYEYNGYTIQAPVRCSIFKPVDSNDSVVVISDNSIYATVKFINSGVNVYAPQGIRIEGKTIIIL
jgi:hypothetical protein